LVIKKTPGEKIILKYGDIDAILDDISNAPEISREEKEIRGKKELMKALSKGILSMLKKGYSVKATTNFINEKLSPASITESDVKQYLPKVTRKKLSKRKSSSAIKADDGESPSNIEEVRFGEKKFESQAENNLKSNVEAEVESNKENEKERVYLEVDIKYKDVAKKQGAQWDRDKKQWYAPPGVDPELIRNAVAKAMVVPDDKE
jgi:hypothetical protein